MAETFYLVTLGCRINQYESQALRESWRARGYLESFTPSQADVVVVNSCAVTARAVQDVRRTVRRLHREAPEASIVVTGCAAQVHVSELSGLPGVVMAVPQSEKKTLLASPLPGNRPQESPPPDFAISDYDRSRPVLKIQDGCSHGCTYCIVPKARGKARSRNPSEAIEEALRLAGSGFMELTVSGTNLGQFGRDLDPARDLWDFLIFLHQALEGLARPPRIRLSSLEPSQLGSKALDTLAVCPLIVPHLHLSLQSASPEVLRRMGRGHYGPQQVADFLSRLQRIWPLYGLGADFLLGFPGESRRDFELTLDFVRKQPFTYGHVFSFSARPGTPAAAMTGRIPPAELKDRSKTLRDLLAAKKLRFLHELCDLPALEVILEGGPSAKGMSQYFAECLFKEPVPGAGTGSLLSVRPVGVRNRQLLVEHGKDTP